ncbi:transmembrane 4 L6 family member 5-like [Hyperolius riggenbachi]|uniref:transmembrane 4 L6 family member 5-like n=1 Tax=Hyperolius riggenbachi TaxID=752182 RepID=UPI0035A38636
MISFCAREGWVLASISLSIPLCASCSTNSRGLALLWRYNRPRSVSSSPNALLRLLLPPLHPGATSLTMCTGKCSRFIGITLYPLAVISIVSNVILFFPSWQTDPIRNPKEQITPEVLYLGGILGSGILILIPASHIQATGREGCCNNRCGMFLSIIFAAIGVAGSLYGFVVSTVGMVIGPQCRFWKLLNVTGGPVWGRPFDADLEQFSEDSYLFNRDMWDTCVYPVNVVEFNIILFSIMLASSGISLILCAIQMLNGLFGCLCGTCREERLDKMQLS